MEAREVAGAVDVVTWEAVVAAVGRARGWAGVGATEAGADEGKGLGATEAVEAAGAVGSEAVGAQARETVAARGHFARLARRASFAALAHLCPWRSYQARLLV